jgi:imidazole glycerol-phosphate synthase subunit HisF
MLKKRLIVVLILRDGQVVQSVRFRHTNVIHWNPATAVEFFNHWAVDEIVALDVSRSLEKRDKFDEAVSALSRKCFVPLTVGGWVTSVDEMRKLLRLGADKVVINTAAARRPELITECARVFGAQCVVVSIDVKRNTSDRQVVFIDRGREETALEAPVWASEAERRGAGEILLNSIDHDGNRQGYDLVLLKSVVKAVRLPVIAFGGVFEWRHLVEGVVAGGADAVAAANIFHYTEHSTRKAKEFMKQSGLDVR